MNTYFKSYAIPIPFTFHGLNLDRERERERERETELKFYRTSGAIFFLVVPLYISQTFIICPIISACSYAVLYYVLPTRSCTFKDTVLTTGMMIINTFTELIDYFANTHVGISS